MRSRIGQRQSAQRTIAQNKIQMLIYSDWFFSSHTWWTASSSFCCVSSISFSTSLNISFKVVCPCATCSSRVSVMSRCPPLWTELPTTKPTERDIITNFSIVLRLGESPLAGITDPVCAWDVYLETREGKKDRKTFLAPTIASDYSIIKATAHWPSKMRVTNKSYKSMLPRHKRQFEYIIQCNVFLWWKSWIFSSHYPSLQYHMILVLKKHF